MNTSSILRATAELVERAESQGVRVYLASIAGPLYPSVTLMPADDADAPELATVLGLSGPRRGGTAGDIEVWRATVDGIDVKVQRTASTPAFEFVAFSDSEPAGHPGFPSFERYGSREDATREGQARYGQVRWEQSGADEFAFTDDHGRTGHVVVRQFTPAVIR